MKNQTTQEQNELITQIVRGQIPAANDFVEYLADKVQTAMLELEQVNAHKRQLTMQFEQVMKREISLRSELDSYGMDILHWQERGETDAIAIETTMGDGLEQS